MRALWRCLWEPRGAARLIIAAAIAMAAIVAGASCRGEAPGPLEVEVRGIGMDPQTDSPVMFLQDKASSRGIPVWIGPNEASVIRMELEHITPPRPLTHDLLKSILDELDATVERIVVEDLKDTTYYATVVIKAGGRRLTIDSRPSDAVALALKCKAPLFISKELVDKGLLIDLGAPESRGEIEQIYGLSVQDISASVARYFELPDDKGAIVTDIEPGGPAEAAGIRKGDVIRTVEGKAVKNVEDLIDSLSERTASETILVGVFRKGAMLQCVLRNYDERAHEAED